MTLRYPTQPCGVPYEKFRAGWTFRDAYEALAYKQDAQGRTFKPSQRRIVGLLGKMKKQEFEQYQADCDQKQESKKERNARYARYLLDAEEGASAALFGLKCTCRKKRKRR